MRFGRNPRKWGKPPEDKNTEYWTNKIVIRALNSKMLQNKKFGIYNMNVLQRFLWEPKFIL